MRRCAPLLLATLLQFACAVSPGANAAPVTLFWEGDHLLALREAPREDLNPELRGSLEQLRAAADVALGQGPYSVTDKSLTPPSGDKHDYMSFSRYWWPNPDTPDGLPYVRRDGEVNRKLLKNGDRNRIGAFYEDVEALALAAYLLDDERSADHARELLRVWFLNPETRMNPNLNYAQAVPGVADGRAPGVIDTRHFVRVIDGALLLESIGKLSSEEMSALRSWFSEFLDWLMTSELGKKEYNARNNHGVWFAAQASMIALFVGQTELAERLVTEARDERLGHSIEPDGSQPEELRRTRSLHYSLFTLSAYSVIARAGEHLGIDLWRHETPDGASLAVALDFAAPYLSRQDEWPHPMLGRFAVSDRQSQLFFLASSRLGDVRYLELLDRAPTRYHERRLAPLLFERASSAERPR